jgi:hypothetical protein
MKALSARVILENNFRSGNRNGEAKARAPERGVHAASSLVL